MMLMFMNKLFLLETKTYKQIKHKLRFYNPKRYLSSGPPWKVLFFGTDTFSLSSLKLLCNEYRSGNLIKRLGVVTDVNKSNPVIKYAQQEDLILYDWPPSHKDIENEKFDVGIVVSFGHLIPEDLLKIFSLPMINVHASLLPRWRGAAPIIHAIANGDTKTGITIMKIEPRRFDVGEIVSQVPVNVPYNMKMPELYTQLADLGAQELIMCLKDLPTKLKNAKPQPSYDATYAPKIHPKFGEINWEKMTSEQIYNLGRALDSLYPLLTTWQTVPVKLFDIERNENELDQNENPSHTGYVEYDRASKKLKVLCCDRRYISIGRISVLGKKVMVASDFNNGYLKKVPSNLRFFR